MLLRVAHIYQTGESAPADDPLETGVLPSAKRSCTVLLVNSCPFCAMLKMGCDEGGPHYISQAGFFSVSNRLALICVPLTH